MIITKAWIRKLFREISGWVQERVIEPEQAERIKAKYSKQLEYNRLLSSLFIFGSILVGLGIILFIASNWQYLSKTAKLGLIFFSIIGFNVLGFYFRFERGNLFKLGEVLFFLGAVSFGAGIWLIAQIFQIPYNYANGLLFWIIGILPMVFLLRSKTILILSSILLPIWLGVVISKSPLRPVYSFFLLLAVIVYLSYRQRLKVPLFISILSMAFWLSHYLGIHLVNIKTRCYSMNVALLYANMFISYGFILYSLGMSRLRNMNIRGFFIFYKLIAIIFILISNYSLTFAHYYEAQVYKICSPVIVIYIFYLSSIIILSRYAKNKIREESNKEARIILLFLIIQSIFMHFGFLGGTAISIFYNVILFAEIIVFMYLGYLLREESIFRLTLYIFALNILTRYFDTFWKILPRSIFFIIGGLILLIGGVYMEKKRKVIEQNMKNKISEAI